jgi:SM-20-related protein
MASVQRENGETRKYETLISGLLEEQFGMVDGFIPAGVVAGLRQNLWSLLEEGSMHAAGVGKHFSYQQNLKVRGDQICWLQKDTKDPFEKAFFARVAGFIDYLNATCYTGINDVEFHYAWYEEGSYYKRHLDQFKTDYGRKFSLVTYLNDGWTEADGGKLVLYLADREVAIYPYAGRSVFFGVTCSSMRSGRPPDPGSASPDG